MEGIAPSNVIRTDRFYMGFKHCNVTDKKRTNKAQKASSHGREAKGCLESLKSVNMPQLGKE